MDFFTFILCKLDNTTAVVGAGAGQEDLYSRPSIGLIKYVK